MSWGRCFAACMRHLWAFWRGEECDPESGHHHLLHAGCCVMYLYAYAVRKSGNDDRFIVSDLVNPALTRHSAPSDRTVTVAVQGGNATILDPTPRFPPPHITE
jgi:hypothetical protein